MGAFEWASIRHEGVEVFRRCALDDGSILTVRPRVWRYAWAHRGPARDESGRLSVHAEGRAETAEMAERAAEDYVLRLRDAERSLSEIRQFSIDEICDLFELSPEERQAVLAEHEHRGARLDRPEG